MPESAVSESTAAERAAQFALSKSPLRPRVAVVLGSGLGAFARELTDSVTVSYETIPHFPASTAPGHAGRLLLGKLGNIPLATLQGRAHLYEGYSPAQVIFPMRVLHRMGIKAVVLTNAGGGINPQFTQGCLMVLSDHINFQGSNPLIGRNDESFGLRFFDMTEAYDKHYRAAALAARSGLKVDVFEGVYLAVSGPSYETPAEIRAFRTLGADVVGMSTVPEVIAARHMNMKVLAISCITNLAAGISKNLLSHQEVMETGERVQQDLSALLRAVIPFIARDVEGS